MSRKFVPAIGVYDNVITHEYELHIIGSTLDANGKYEFELCGINTIGQSPKCAPTSSIVYVEDRRAHYNQEMNVKLVRALSSTEINVTWSRPSNEEVNGKLLAYRILYVNTDYINTSKVKRLLFTQSNCLLLSI